MIRLFTRMNTIAIKSLSKLHRSFVVTRQVGDIDCEKVWSDRGGATLNLLKEWRETETLLLLPWV